MRRKKQEITDPAILEEVLSTSEICRLGFVDNNRAYIVPFNYGYQDGVIYIHCAREGKKLELLKENNEVCFEIEQLVRIEPHELPCKWDTTYRSIIGYGKVEIIDDQKLKQEGMDVIMKHNVSDKSMDLNYGKHRFDAILLLRIEISELKGKQSLNLARG